MLSVSSRANYFKDPHEFTALVNWWVDFILSSPLCNLKEVLPFVLPSNISFARFVFHMIAELTTDWAQKACGNVVPFECKFVPPR
jgi:hypothetical protein